MHTAEVVEFCNHSAKAERGPMGRPAEESVEGIDDIFLPHEDRCGDICSRGCR